MKKLIILILIFSPYFGFSQIRIGISAIGNFNNYDYYQTGFGTGLSTEYKINNEIILNSDIFIQHKEYSWAEGFGIILNNSNTINQYSFTSTTINLPVKINYYIKQKIFLESGLNFNYRINIDPYNYENNSSYKELSETIKKVDLGLILGIGLKISSKFTTRAERNFGLTKILNDINNSYYSLSLSYYFN